MFLVTPFRLKIEGGGFENPKKPPRKVGKVKRIMRSFTFNIFILSLDVQLKWKKIEKDYSKHVFCDML